MIVIKKERKCINMLSRNKGITLISMTIMVLVMVIISNIIVYNTSDTVKIEKVKDMYNDIELLNSKVSSYYMQYEALPTLTKYTNTEAIENSGILGVNDSEVFYVIDLKLFQNLSLNNGSSYEIIDDKLEADSNLEQSTINSYKDVYIINEKSHNIFYVKGITLDDKTYYTYSEGIDTVEIVRVTIEDEELV